MSVSSLGEEAVVAPNAPLFFREEWKETPAETPVTQDHVQNSELTLRRHGPDADSIKKSHHDEIPNDPWYIWSGSCEKGRWAISLRKKNELVDLRDGAIRLRTRQSGPHILKVVIELEDSTWLVSRQGFGETPDWHVFDVPIRTLGWSRLNIETVEAGETVKNPDLSRVQAVGWTDLLAGKGSDGCTRVDWIEVYGRNVGRG